MPLDEPDEAPEQPPYTPRFNIRQLTDVLHCNLQHHFHAIGAEYFSMLLGPGAATRATSALPDQLEPAH
jgi:hypothetical protein